MQSSLYLGVPAVSAAFLLDRATKSLVLRHADDLGTGIELLPFLNLVLVRNTGISFGMLSAIPWWVWTVGTIAVVGWLTHLLLQAQTRAMIVSLSALIGGALGNLTDRLVYGAVTDFIDLHYGGWHWPAFNMADIAICLGAIGLLFLSMGNEEDPVVSRPKPNAKT